jgi:hypothetical protein
MKIASQLEQERFNHHLEIEDDELLNQGNIVTELSTKI